MTRLREQSENLQKSSLNDRGRNEKDIGVRLPNTGCSGLAAPFGVNTMTWYKERLKTLLAPYKEDVPYCFWNSTLFLNIHPEFIPDQIDRVLNDVAITIGTWERVVKTAQLWGDANVLNAVNHGYLLTLMFLCLAYPREAVIMQLARDLPRDTDEGRLCNALADKDGPFRHIRNSIAHGDFHFTDDGRAIKFTDRDWVDTRTLQQVELDSLIVFDVLMSAFETQLRTKASSRRPIGRG